MDSLGDLDHAKLLNASLALQGVFILCFMICSFVVAKTANMGFNVVLTALLYCVHVAGAHHVLNRSKMPLSVGFVIGVSVMMTVLSLMTAIFWGQLSGCQSSFGGSNIGSGFVKQYTCSNPDAYGAVCAFATLLFIVQAAFTALLVLWRDDFITESASSYDDIHGSPAIPSDGGVPPYTSYPSSQSSYNQPTSSADL